MITFLLTAMTRRWRVAVLALLGLVLLPHLALAVTTANVIEMFKYSYMSENMMYLASVETVLYNLLKRRKKRVGGRGQFLQTYRTQNGGVIKGAAEGGTLTSRRAQPDTAEASFSLVEFHTVWDITWKMLRQASRSQDAMENALDFMDNAVKTRIFRVLNAMVCSATGKGELGILSATDDQTTITINSMPFLDQGMIVDLMDASDNTTALVAATTVSDVAVQSREVTIGSAPTGSAATDFFVVADQVASGVSYSMNGLLSWLSDANPAATKGNLGGINRSTAGNGFYKGNLLSNSGTNRPFTDDLALDGANLCRENGGIQPDRYMANGNVLKRYHGDVIKDKYFSYNKVSAVGAGGEKVGLGREGMDEDNSPDGTGGTPYTLNGKPFHQEPFFPANRIAGWADEHFFLGHDGIEYPTVLSEVFEGQVPYFAMTTSTKFDVWGYCEQELISSNPKAGVQWSDIAES